MSCKPGEIDSSYLASPDFMSQSCHVITGIAIPILIYGGYCILFKTPSNMRPMKMLLLNLHVWNCLSDLTISCFGIPYLHLVAISGYGLGVINSPGLLIYCDITFIFGMSTSVLSLYENRYFILFCRNKWWGYARKPYLIFMYLSIPFYFLPPFFNIPEQETARIIALSKVPCLSPFTFSDRKLFVLALDQYVSFACIFVACALNGCSIGIFLLLTFYNLVTKSHTLSATTLKIQNNFLLAISIQSLAHFIVALVPGFIYGFLIIFSYQNQKINNLICLSLASHGVVTTIVMVLMHKPYQKFTFSWMLNIKREKKSHTELNAVKYLVSVRF